jgi:beta-lactamase class A
MSQKRFLFITIFILITAVVLVNKYGPSSPAHLASEAKKQHETTVQNSVQLQNIVNSWAAQNTFSSSVVVMELGGKERTVSYHGTDSIVPASTFKLYVGYAVLHAVEQGKYSLQSPAGDDNNDSIQTDLTGMIVDSDNDAARALGFLLGWQNINALLHSQGMNSTDLNNYIGSSTTPVGDKHTTANDLATLLRKLQAGNLLDKAHTQLLLGLMEQQGYRQRIPAGVPRGVTVADKPGWLSPADGDSENAQNDAAIVYGPKSTYVLVITTTDSSTAPLTNLSKQIYNYLET